MMLAQRVAGITRVVAAAAVLGTAAACGNTGGLGNILGGVLAPQPLSVGGTVQGVDAQRRQINLTQSNGQAVTVLYDDRTKVVYQNQLYAVTSLEYGDQIGARLQEQSNNTYYADSIWVTQPVNNSTSGTMPNSTTANVQSLQGTVRQIDRNAGSFTIDANSGVQLIVTLPYRANSQDVNRFNNLRVGDFVRFYGVFVNNQRVELRQFY
jgi:hypothetical protein